MSTKKWKNGELKSLLSEAWGFKMDLSKLNESQELYGEMGGCGDDVTGIEMVDGEEVGVTDVDDAEGVANELLSLAQRIADMLGQGSSISSISDEEAELEEQSKTDSPDRVAGRVQNDDRRLDEEEDEVVEEEVPGKRDKEDYVSSVHEQQIKKLIIKALKEARTNKGK